VRQLDTVQPPFSEHLVFEPPEVSASADTDSGFEPRAYESTFPCRSPTPSPAGHGRCPRNDDRCQVSLDMRTSEHLLSCSLPSLGLLSGIFASLRVVLRGCTENREPVGPRAFPRSLCGIYWILVPRIWRRHHGFDRADDLVARRGIGSYGRRPPAHELGRGVSTGPTGLPSTSAHLKG
jgi:hypothetical protein